MCLWTNFHGWAMKDPHSFCATLPHALAKWGCWCNYNRITHDRGGCYKLTPKEMRSENSLWMKMLSTHFSIKYGEEGPGMDNAHRGWHKPSDGFLAWIVPVDTAVWQVLSPQDKARENKSKKWFVTTVFMIKIASLASSVAWRTRCLSSPQLLGICPRITCTAGIPLIRTQHCSLARQVRPYYDSSRRILQAHLFSVCITLDNTWSVTHLAKQGSGLARFHGEENAIWGAWGLRSSTLWVVSTVKRILWRRITDNWLMWCRKYAFPTRFVSPLPASVITLALFALSEISQSWLAENTSALKLGEPLWPESAFLSHVVNAQLDSNFCIRLPPPHARSLAWKARKRPWGWWADGHSALAVLLVCWISLILGNAQLLDNIFPLLHSSDKWRILACFLGWVVSSLLILGRTWYSSAVFNREGRSLISYF